MFSENTYYIESLKQYAAWEHEYNEIEGSITTLLGNREDADDENKRASLTAEIMRLTARQGELKCPLTYGERRVLSLYKDTLEKGSENLVLTYTTVMSCECANVVMALRKLGVREFLFMDCYAFEEMVKSFQSNGCRPAGLDTIKIKDDCGLIFGERCIKETTYPVLRFRVEGGNGDAAPDTSRREQSK